MILPEMRGFHGHLLKPFCVFAAMVANPDVEWVLLLDSDALVNPHWMNGSLHEALASATDNNAHMMVPANKDLDGCTGVALFNSRHIETVCRWCYEVQGNRYGLWDQTALWSVMTELFAERVESIRPWARAVHVAADRHQQKKVMPVDADKEWYKIWTNVQTVPNLLAIGPVRPIPNLANLYGCSRGRAQGEAAGWVWHPAGRAGSLCEPDQKALERVLTEIPRRKWV